MIRNKQRFRHFCLLIFDFCFLISGVAYAADRSVLVLQYPPEIKVPLTLFRTGVLDKIDGEAEIRREFKHEKTTKVSVTIKNVPAPSSVKPEYTTYVVWAVDEKGGFTKFGATMKDVKLDTPLIAFGIVVSLEADANVAKPAGPFVLESQFPDKKNSFFGMTRVVYSRSQ